MQQLIPNFFSVLNSSPTPPTPQNGHVRLIEGDPKGPANGETK
jgi:hypothetical protein